MYQTTRRHFPRESTIYHINLHWHLKLRILDIQRISLLERLILRKVCRTVNTSVAVIVLHFSDIPDSAFRKVQLFSLWNVKRGNLSHFQFYSRNLLKGGRRRKGKELISFSGTAQNHFPLSLHWQIIVPLFDYVQQASCCPSCHWEIRSLFFQTCWWQIYIYIYIYIYRLASHRLF
jgi:hypothetical protein